MSDFYCPDVLDEKCDALIQELYELRENKTCPELELDYLDLYDCAKDIGCTEWITLNCMLEEGFDWGPDAVCGRLDCGFLKEVVVEEDGDGIGVVEIVIISLASVNLLLIVAAFIYIKKCQK